MALPTATLGEESITSADLDLVIVGGCGHVGLPLALSFADVGCRVGIYDIDATKIERVRSGLMPFMERGAEDLLRRVLPTGRLHLSDRPQLLQRADVAGLVMGTTPDDSTNLSIGVPLT